MCPGLALETKPTNQWQMSWTKVGRVSELARVSFRFPKNKNKRKEERQDKKEIKRGGKRVRKKKGRGKPLVNEARQRPKRGSTKALRDKQRGAAKQGDEKTCTPYINPDHALPDYVSGLHVGLVAHLLLHTHSCGAHRGGRALNVADSSACIRDRFARARTVCTQACARALLLLYSHLSSLCSSRRNVSIAALDLWVTVPSPIDTQRGVTLRGCSQGTGTKVSAGSLLNPRNASRDPRDLDQSGQLTWYFHRERYTARHLRASISRAIFLPLLRHFPPSSNN